MQTDTLLPVENFCLFHNIDFSFINTLHEYGLIELTTKENNSFIPEEDLERLEKLVRLHNDLNLTLEGMEVVTYLLAQLKERREEIILLQNRLRCYEN